MFEWIILIALLIVCAYLYQLNEIRKSELTVKREADLREKAQEAFQMAKDELENAKKDGDEKEIARAKRNYAVYEEHLKIQLDVA